MGYEVGALGGVGVGDVRRVCGWWHAVIIE